MSNQLMHWCRLYGNLVNKKKISRLSDRAFRLYIEILCVATNEGSSDGNTFHTAEELAWVLRRNNDVTFHETVSETENETLIETRKNGMIYVCKWEEYQRPSDKSTKRVKAYRERKKLEKQTNQQDDVTLHETEMVTSRGEERRGYTSIIDTNVSIIEESASGKLIKDEKKEKKAKEPSKTKRIGYDWDARSFVGVTAQDIESWSEAFPALNIEQQLKRAAVWQHENPENRKSNYPKFLFNWFNREQNSARPNRSAGSNRPEKLSDEERDRIVAKRRNDLYGDSTNSEEQRQ